MSDADELRELRRRAYGPGSDIHADPAALERLRLLESRETPADPPPAASEPAPEPEGEHEPRPAPDAAAPARRWRPRRSTVLIALAAVLVLVAAGVVLTVVQRVQTDPLQVGATQVARLAPDPTFELPLGFAGSGEPRVGYQEFAGLRTVISVGVPPLGPSEGAADSATCMTVYQPDYLEVRADGYAYSGTLLLTACSAGAFPAEVTFTVTDQSPDGLRDTYPLGTAFQFVYDEADQEIVVFQG